MWFFSVQNQFKGKWSPFQIFILQLFNSEKKENQSKRTAANNKKEKTDERGGKVQHLRTVSVAHIKVAHEWTTLKCSTQWNAMQSVLCGPTVRWTLACSGEEEEMLLFMCVCGGGATFANMEPQLILRKTWWWRVLTGWKVGACWKFNCRGLKDESGGRGMGQDTLPVSVGMRKTFLSVSTENYWHPVVRPVEGYLLIEEWNMRATDTRRSGWLKCSFNGCQYLFNRPCVKNLIPFEQKHICTALTSTAHVCPVSLLTLRR